MAEQRAAVRDTARRLEADAPTWPVLLAGLRQPKRFFGDLYQRITKDRIFTVAAAMAYYFFFALFPLLLFAVALVTLVPLAGLQDWIVGVTLRYLPEEARALVDRTLRAVLGEERGGLVSVGAALALWGGSAAFTTIIDGLNIAYRVEESRPWWRVQLLALVLTAGLSLFMIPAFVLGVFGRQLAERATATLGPSATLLVLVLRWVVVLGLVLCVVGAIYYYAPDVEQRWRWVTPGSVLFVLSFAAASAAFSAYVTHFGSYDKTYGTLGAVIILLLWMYLLALLLLLGGELNALLEHRSPAGKQPGDHDQPPGRVQYERVKEAAHA